MESFDVGALPLRHSDGTCYFNGRKVPQQLLDKLGGLEELKVER